MPAKLVVGLGLGSDPGPGCPVPRAPSLAVQGFSSSASRPRKGARLRLLQFPSSSARSLPVNKTFQIGKAQLKLRMPIKSFAPSRLRVKQSGSRVKIGFVSREAREVEDGRSEGGGPERSAVAKGIIVITSQFLLRQDFGGQFSLAFRKKTGGEGGIRTLGRDLNPYSGLANRPFRPLRHLSETGRSGNAPPPASASQFSR